MHDTNIKIQKSPALRRFEFVLLLISLCVLAIRATYTESPYTGTIEPLQLLTNEGFSLLISSILILTFIAWLAAAFITGKIYYRFGWIEIGTALFIAAGFVSLFAASDKRSAITDLTTIAAVMLTAVMLTQLLDSDTRIKLALMAIVACGITGTFQCFEQYQSSNQMLIEQYEQNPASQLEQLGIEPGTFKHFSYEHRLYSKDVRGFFTTGNSAGSFFIMSFFAAAALFWKRYTTNSTNILIAIIITATILIGLILTHSKGAAAALFVTIPMAAAALLFGNSLRKIRTPLLIVCLIAIIALIAVTVSYGTKNNTLPGGNSMLVRWQYWSAAIKIYLLKPFTGIGGGNFGSYYTHFKQPNALESVMDPHCFPLSILSQYGPLGLLGFCAAFALPMLKLIFTKNPTETYLPHAGSNHKKKLIIIAIITIAAVLIFRPLLLRSEMGETTAETSFMVVYLFILPAVIMAIAWLMMIAGEAKLEQDANLTDKSLSSDTGTFLFCSIAAVALHNLIDFAIFEPGISTAFWITAACMVAHCLNKTAPIIKPIQIPTTARIIGLLVLLTVNNVFLGYAVIRPVIAGKLIQQTYRGTGDINAMLDKASKIDPLSPAAPNLHGRIYTRQFKVTGRSNQALLHLASENFADAAKRNKVSYKYPDKLSETYFLLADLAAPKAAKGLRETALFWVEEALKRYPNSDKLNLQAAQIAESLGRNEKALDLYKKTVEIEDSYREMFRKMYPEREMFSRLGEDKYRFAKSKIEKLK